MLIPNHITKQGTFERIIRDKNGVLVRLTFEVVEINGELKGRMLSVQPVHVIVGDSVIPAKAGIRTQQDNMFLLPPPAKIVSPYFSYTQKDVVSPLSGLEFLTSIKIRAPSF